MTLSDFLNDVTLSCGRFLVSAALMKGDQELKEIYCKYNDSNWPNRTPDCFTPAIPDSWLECNVIELWSYERDGKTVVSLCVNVAPILEDANIQYSCWNIDVNDYDEIYDVLCESLGVDKTFFFPEEEEEVEINDDATFEITCPNCKKAFEITGAELKSGMVTCPVCDDTLMIKYRAKK